MRYTIIYSLLLILFACNNDLEQEIDKKNKSLLVNGLQDTINPLNSLHPSNLSPDNSWMIALDIKEGKLLSYTIQYQNGDTLTKKIANKDIISGELDCTSAKFLDNSTYQICSDSSAQKEYLEFLIQKDGTYQFIKKNS